MKQWVLMKHNQLADYLRGRASASSIEDLCQYIALELQKESSVAIHSAEVHCFLEQWAKRHATQPGEPLSLPPRSAAVRHSEARVCHTDGPNLTNTPRPHHCGRCLSKFVEDLPDGRLHCLDCQETWTPGVEQN